MLAVVHTTKDNKSADDSQRDDCHSPRGVVQNNILASMIATFSV